MGVSMDYSFIFTGDFSDSLFFWSFAFAVFWRH